MGFRRWNSSWALSNPERWCCESAALNMPANLENSSMATDWKRSASIPITKKGNAKECSNTHKVALISQTSNVIPKILQARLQQQVKSEIPVQGAKPPIWLHSPNFYPLEFPPTLGSIQSRVSVTSDHVRVFLCVTFSCVCPPSTGLSLLAEGRLLPMIYLCVVCVSGHESRVFSALFLCTIPARQ